MSHEKERCGSLIQISDSLEAQKRSNYTFDTAVALHVLNGLSMPTDVDVQIVGKLDNTKVHEAITLEGVTYHSLYALPEIDPRVSKDEQLRHAKANRIAIEGLFAVAKHHRTEDENAYTARDQAQPKHSRKKWAATAGAFGFVGVNGYFTLLGANAAEIPLAAAPIIAGTAALSTKVVRQYYESVDRQQEKAVKDAAEHYSAAIDLCARNNTVLVVKD